MTMTRVPPTPGSYADVVRRARRLVERWVPAGSTVAVLSRGDPALVSFWDRVGWHLPCYDDGRYVGYHPADGQDAVRAVEAVRGRGADHLLVPEPSSWWLTHYEGLRAHLDRWGPPLACEPGVATLFRLSGPPARDAADALRIAVLADLAEIAGLLLPPGATVTVVDDPPGDRDLLPRHGVSWLPPDQVRAPRPFATDYVLVPCTHYGWLRARDDVRRELGRSGRLVTWQEHVGAIYELDPDAAVATS